MNGSSVSALHALNVVPRITRPGGTVRALLSTPNAGMHPTPEGHVRFLPGPGLTALGALEALAPSAAPGGAIEAHCDFTVDGACNGGAPVVVGAVLTLAGEEYACVPVHAEVRGIPVLDGPGSGVRLELLDEDRVRVSAGVCNSGDGVARDVSLTVPAPAGCTTSAKTSAEASVLAPGERLELQYDAELHAPLPEVCADDASVTYATGERRALPRSETVVMRARLAAPRVRTVWEQRTVTLAVEVVNDGWADALDVCCEVTLPAGISRIPGGAREGACELQVTPRRGGFSVVVPRVAARCAATLSFGLRCSGDASRTCVIALAGHRVPVLLVPEPSGALLLTVLQGPVWSEPGATVALQLLLRNTGAISLLPRLALHGAGECEGADVPRRVMPGAHTTAGVCVRVPADAADGDELAFTLRASAGEVVAEATFRLVIRERAWIANVGTAEEPVLRAVGHTDAADVQVHCGEECLRLGTLRRGDERALPAEREADATVTVAGRAVLTLPASSRRPSASAVLQAPAGALAFAGVRCSAIVAAHEETPSLTLLAAVPPGAVYVAGSTEVDGVSLLDRAGQSPLAAGLTLYDIPRGARIALAWSVSADGSSEALAHQLRVRDGARERVLAESITIVSAPPPIALTTSDLPYGIAAHAQNPAPARSRPEKPAEAAERESGVTLVARLGEPRRRGDGGGAAADVLTAALIFPHATAAGDARADEAFAEACAALGENADRLFVKLRIPGLACTAADLEDRVLRRALLRALRFACDAPDAPAGAAPSVTVSRTALRALAADLEDAPLGGEAFFAALAACTVARCGADAGLEAALARFSAALTGVHHGAAPEAELRHAREALEGHLHERSAART